MSEEKLSSRPPSFPRASTQKRAGRSSASSHGVPRRRVHRLTATNRHSRRQNPASRESSRTDISIDAIREALTLTEIVETRFTDRERGGYFTTGEGHEALIARTKNLHDGALPAATGVQALNLARLGALTERQAWLDRAEAVAGEQAKLVNRHPRLFSQLLCAVDFLRAPHRQVVISGKAGAADTQALLDTLAKEEEELATMKHNLRNIEAHILKQMLEMSKS